MLQTGPAEGLFSCKSDFFHSYHLNFKVAIRNWCCEWWKMKAHKLGQNVEPGEVSSLLLSRMRKNLLAIVTLTFSLFQRNVWPPPTGREGAWWLEMPRQQKQGSGLPISFTLDGVVMALACPLSRPALSTGSIDTYPMCKVLCDTFRRKPGKRRIFPRQGVSSSVLL